jgi:hypothetical protein
LSVKLTSIVLCSPRQLGRPHVVSRLKVAADPNGRDFFWCGSEMAFLGYSHSIVAGGLLLMS